MLIVKTLHNDNVLLLPDGRRLATPYLKVILIVPDGYFMKLLDVFISVSISSTLILTKRTRIWKEYGRIIEELLTYTMKIKG